MYHDLLNLIGFVITLLLYISLEVGAANEVEVTTTKLYQQIYTDLLAFPCVRLLNATGTIGCSGKPTTGTLYSVSNDANLKTFLNGDDFSGSYILILPLELLTRSNIALARSSGKVKGILVIEGSPRGSQILSHDSPCPDCGQTQYVRQDWNPLGTGLLYDDLTDFPMFALFNASSTLSNSLADIQRASLNNQPGMSPRYGVELSAFMNAAHNANDCLRRNMCKPLGGQSLYAPLFDGNIGNNEIVMVTAALDDKAMFHDLAQGAQTRMSSIAAVLTAASALSSIDRSSFQRQILFALFNGESWGHIGSRAFAKDIDTFKCGTLFTSSTTACPYNQGACSQPCIYDTTFQQIGLNTNSIAHILDGNVLSGPPNQLRVYATNRSMEVGTFENITIISDKGIPPSPALAFLERNPRAKAWVITTMDNQYPVNSSTEYDDSKSFNSLAIDTICAAANVIARNALQLSLNSSTIRPNVTVNCTLAQTLFNCLTNANQCPFGSVISNVPRNSYSSVSIYGVRLTWPGIVADAFLSLVTAGQRGDSCQTSDQCKDPTPTCASGMCVNSRVRYHLGFPSGLQVDPNTGIWSVSDSNLPHWVESNWDVTSIRLFAIPPFSMQMVELLVGAAVTSLSVVLVWSARKSISME